MCKGKAVGVKYIIDLRVRIVLFEAKFSGKKL